MNSRICNVQKLNKNAKIPEKAFSSDAGFDVFTMDTVYLGPGQRVSIPLGFSIELPENTCAWIQGKSGLAVKHGITTIGNIIDSGYRGECHVILVNHGDEPKTFEPGDKVAQMLIVKLAPVTKLREVKQLNNSDRGDGKFGSTGK